jgi:hypothetical protein
MEKKKSIIKGNGQLLTIVINLVECLNIDLLAPLQMVVVWNYPHRDPPPPPCPFPLPVF